MPAMSRKKTLTKYDPAFWMNPQLRALIKACRPWSVPVSMSFEMADSSPEYESSQGSVRESSVLVSEVSTKNIKHPDLDCQRVRQVVNLLFSPKSYQLTLKQLGIPEDKSDGLLLFVIISRCFLCLWLI